MSQRDRKERCLVCRQPVGVGEGGSMVGAMRGDTMYPVGHLCKVCKEQALRDAEPQHEDEDEDEDGSSCAMGDEFTRFLADPTVHGLAGALDEPGYGLRVGVLFGAGRITAGEARRLLLGHEADWPAGVPDDERHAARAPEGQEEEEEDGSSARNRD